MVPRGPGAEPSKERDRHGQRRRTDHVAELELRLRVVAFGDRSAIILRVDLRDVVSDLGNGGTQRFEVGVLSDRSSGLLAGEVDVGGFNALLFSKDALDPNRA